MGGQAGNHSDREWVTYYKGGQTPRYYGESSLVVDWDSSRQTLQGFLWTPLRSSADASNYQYFFLPGITVHILAIREVHFCMPPGGCSSGTKSSKFNSQKQTTGLLGLLDAYIGMLHLLNSTWPE